jgi:hypothetical protein
MPGLLPDTAGVVSVRPPLAVFVLSPALAGLVIVVVVVVAVVGGRQSSPGASAALGVKGAGAV